MVWEEITCAGQRRGKVGRMVAVQASTEQYKKVTFHKASRPSCDCTATYAAAHTNKEQQQPK